MTAYVGRGIVSLGGVSVGVSSELTLTLERELWRRESWDDTRPGGPESVSIVPTRALVSITLHDFSAANLNKLILGSGNDGMIDDGTEVALSFAGTNCTDDSIITLTAPRFLILGTTGLDLIGEDFADPVLEGELIRAPGSSPEWFTLELT